MDIRLFGINGTGTANQLARWTGTATQTGSAALTWDDTNSRLAMGSGRFTAGTSFPSSPSAGDKHTHTSRRREYFYDGTRWVSEPYLLPLVPYYQAPPQAYSATGVPYVAGLPPGSDLWIDSFQCGHWFGSVNSTSNYWTVQLGADTTSGTTALASYDTKAATTAGYWLPTAITTFTPNALGRSTYFSVNITITKTGSAPAIEIYPALAVREIG